MSLFKHAYRFIMATVMVAVIMLISIKSTEIHNTFLRAYVGSKVYEVWGDRGAGTGFHVNTPKGVYLLTNNHVCQLADANDMLILKQGNKKYKRKVFKRSKKTDLCLVQPVDKNGLYLSNEWNVGDTANLVGHPGLRPLSIHKGEYIGKDRVKVLFGFNIPEDRCFGQTIVVQNPPRSPEELLLYMSGIDSICVIDVPSIQFNGISYAGASGSPMVDDYGFLTGVLFAGSRETLTDTQVVPLEDVKEFFKSL